MKIQTAGIFARKSVSTSVVSSLAVRFRNAGVEFFEDLRTVGELSKELDLVIALGGDGTVIRALKFWPGVPVLAVNFGHVGFLSQCDGCDLLNAADRVLDGKCEIEERLALDVTYKDQSFRCINEVVVRGGTRMIVVDVSIDGKLVQSPRGDGVIVGTPTGSTAYLLSTGGPLVTPKVDCILIQPLNEHNLSSRTVIVPGDVPIELKTWKDHRLMGKEEIGMSIDGQERLPLRGGESIQIRRSAQPVRLVTLEGDCFFKNLRQRLHW